VSEVEILSVSRVEMLSIFEAEFFSSKWMNVILIYNFLLLCVSQIVLLPRLQFLRRLMFRFYCLRLGLISVRFFIFDIYQMYSIWILWLVHTISKFPRSNRQIPAALNPGIFFSVVANSMDSQVDDPCSEGRLKSSHINACNGWKTDECWPFWNFL
jgi:hypothetical protein